MFSEILKEAFKSGNGYATVEAAVVIPLVILIVFGIISISVTKYEEVSEVSGRHREAAVSWFDDRAPHAEDVLRARWYLEKNKEQ